MSEHTPRVEPADDADAVLVCPDCGHLWSAHFDHFGDPIDCGDDRPESHVCLADCLGAVDPEAAKEDA